MAAILVVPNVEKAAIFVDPELSVGDVSSIFIQTLAFILSNQCRD